ncbi:hypothetical protein Salat_2417600 [Sesamum alatum]|uniref:Uncharacterized protein n=1 Tax=Sesamum alatum TaxID=300844 RepID=A0AAE2CFC7_9LAMI|nr:hypothetical protein Salat_2417600 [Sesamum alatum]
MRNRIEKALQTSRNQYKELTNIIHKQEKKIQFLETKALHLSMFYIASQLLIFLSSSKPSSSAYRPCGNWWKPFFISLSIAVVFGLNFTTTIIKYVRTKYEQDRNFIDQEENYQQMAYLERRHRTTTDGGSTGSLEVDMSKAYTLLQVQPDMFAVYQRYAHLGTSVAVLLAFTALVLHACRSSVCADAPLG